MQFFNPPELETTPEIVSYSMQQAAGRQRKRILTLVIIAAALIVVAIVVGVILGTKDKNKPGAISNVVAQVSITDGGFVPASISIEKGQEITWINSGSAAHNVTADQSALPYLNTTEQMGSGDTYTYIFDKAGTYHYYDPADPKTFLGTITVK